MNRPVKAEYNPKTGLVDLFLEPQKKVPVNHYIRGAVCWPVGRWPGYALAAGQSRDDLRKAVCVFEEYPFWGVNTMDGEAGLWWFLKESYTKYFCRKYYYLADQEVHERYGRQIRREMLVNPKPVFLESPYTKKTELDADNLILEYIDRGALKIDREFEHDRSLKNNFDILSGNLGAQLASHTNGHIDDDDSIPAVKALRALISGLEKTPYRQPVYEEEEIPRSYFS